MDASQILVIILASTLAVFLILAIVLVVILIRVARQIQRVTTSAERAAATFENIVGNVQKAVAPAVVSRFIMDQIQRFTDKQGRRGK
jgi:hypothetical protein